MSWTAERARVASLSRSRDPQDPDLIEARRNLRCLRLEDHIRKVIAEAPPLSDDQRSRLAGLLRDAQTRVRRCPHCGIRSPLSGESNCYCDPGDDQ